MSVHSFVDQSGQCLLAGRILRSGAAPFDGARTARAARRPLEALGGPGHGRDDGPRETRLPSERPINGLARRLPAAAPAAGRTVAPVRANAGGRWRAAGRGGD
jgi:hypothetical protein